MNRSILIVICDFLLLSLLTFSTDINHIAGQGARQDATLEVATNSVATAGQDLAGALKQALEQERQAQRELRQKLAEAGAAASLQRTEITQRQAQASGAEMENAKLHQLFAAARTNEESLNEQLRQSTAQERMSRVQLEEAQAQARQETELAAALRNQLAEASKTNQLAQNEAQKLATQLQLAKAGQQAAADRAALMQQQVQAERAENVQLAEGFKALATNSGALTREIQENRALAPNTIFTEFLTNRVHANFQASRTGFFHIESHDQSRASSVLVTDGAHIFALCHVQDTPLTLWDPGADWRSLSGTLSGAAGQTPIRSLGFDQDDPRVVMMPVSADDARRLGSKIYRISTNPYKFQDAVIVGADTGYYGECDFQIVPDMPQYVKLDRSFLRGLVGKFNPSSGDLVFSRAGEFLGLMVNDAYCLMIHNFAVQATLVCGNDIRQQHSGTTLARLYDVVFRLPPRLQ